jgi:hypothetical protein
MCPNDTHRFLLESIISNVCANLDNAVHFVSCLQMPNSVGHSHNERASPYECVRGIGLQTQTHT